MVNKTGKVAALAECHLAGMGERRQAIDKQRTSRITAWCNKPCEGKKQEGVGNSNWPGARGSIFGQNSQAKPLLGCRNLMGEEVSRGEDEKVCSKQREQ